MKALNDVGDWNELVAKEIKMLQCNLNETEFTIPPSSSDTMVIVVVVLPNAETNSNDVELNLLPRGNNSTSINKSLHAGSAYLLKCKNEGKCRWNSAHCPVHCVEHKLKINNNQSSVQYVMVISYIKPRNDALQPPGDVIDVDRILIINFEEK
jgi:hypothetical protein